MGFIDLDGFDFGVNLSAKEAVEHGIRTSQELASIAFDEAQELIGELKDIGLLLVDVPQIAVALGEVTNTVSKFEKPDSPITNEITANFPTAIDSVELKDVNPLVVDDVPTYEGSGLTINDVAKVEPFNEDAPALSTLPDRTNSIPDVPSKDGLPGPVPLRELILPTPPAKRNTVFEGITPTALDPAPDVTFDYTETPYDSTLLSTLNNQLNDQVNNIRYTGLRPEIEQAIYDRARERTNAATDALIEEIERMGAQAGWEQPTGDEYEAKQKAIQAGINADVGESRNIAIAQANLELQNFQFAFGQAIILEGQLINHNDQVANRALDAAKYAIQASIDIYGLKEKHFNANVELFKAHGAIFKDKLEGELTDLKIYLGEIEGQGLISSLNEQDIKNARLQIDSVLALFDLYEKELESVNTLLKQDELVLNQDEIKIKLFSEKIRAKALQYTGYKDELSGEHIKVQMEDSFANVFSKKIDAFKSSHDVKIAKLESDIRINQEIPLEQNKIFNDIFNTQVGAESDRIKSLADLNKVLADIFDVETRAETARVDGEVRVQGQEIDLLKADAQIELDSLKSNISIVLEKIKLLMNTQETTAKIQASLATSYGSAVNYSAGLSDSVSLSHNRSKSKSESLSNSYSETLSLSA